MSIADPISRELRLDLSQPGLYLRPDYFDLLATLREHAPVARTLDGSWAVTRYDDIRAISRDPVRYVSSRGVLINDPLGDRGSGGADVFSLLHVDPPLHSVYRKVVNRQFTPKAVAGLEPAIRRTVGDALDALGALDPCENREPIDGVADLAAVVPIAVIAELLGIAVEDRAAFRRWSDAVIATPDDPASMGASEDLAAMFAFLHQHVSAPPTAENVLLDLLKGADLDGRALTSAEIMGFFLTLLVAGNETTRTLLSGGMEVLWEHPDQRAALAAAPDRLPDAVEEILRWVTPIQAFGRTAAVDGEVGGQPIAEGDFLVMLYASGNRDEAAFGPTADRFDIGRPVTPTHVAFGFGEHLCLGAALARLEARVFFEELLRRHPRYELAGPVERTRSTLVRGATRMPLVLDP